MRVEAIGSDLCMVCGWVFVQDIHASLERDKTNVAHSTAKPAPRGQPYFSPQDVHFWLSSLLISVPEGAKPKKRSELMRVRSVPSWLEATKTVTLSVLAKGSGLTSMGLPARCSGVSSMTWAAPVQWCKKRKEQI
jgi:hypothetical protein